MRVAIIGGGSAGLVTAHLLGGTHDVTLFEKSPILGGHVRTLNRNVSCSLEPRLILDAGTGRSLWTHEMSGDVWDGALVADGKVYMSSRAGDFHSLQAGREKKLLCSVKLGSPISCQPTAANGSVNIIING